MHLSYYNTTLMPTHCWQRPRSGYCRTPFILFNCSPSRWRLHPLKQLGLLLLSECVFFGGKKRATNIFWAERKEERWEMERGCFFCCAGEAAKIHYLSVLYLFHMLLFSNLSLQILDWENKQKDQSSRLLQPNVPLQTPQRHTAAALSRGHVQECSKMERWMDR